MNTKNTFYTFFIGMVLIIGVGIGASQYIAYTHKIPSKINLFPTGQYQITEKAPDIKTYSNSSAGFTLDFSSNLFTFASKQKGFSLSSPYYVIENYKGTPDGEFKHQFKIDVETSELALLDAIEQYPQLGDLFLQSFSGAMANSFVPSETATSLMIGGKKAFAFTMGIEGTNTMYVFIPQNDKQTLVVTYTYFTDFLAKNVKPTAFTEEQEKAAFDEVMATLKFTK